MKLIKSFSIVGVTALLLSACAITSPEIPATKKLSPMEKPVINYSHRVIQLDVLGNEERYIDYTDYRDDGTYTGTNNEGCSWTSNGDLISPPLSWNNCSDDPKWHSGENRNMEKKGEIWPLAIGSKVKYTFNQINANGESQGRRVRSCKVVGQVNIDVAAGNVDAFKISCTRTNGSYKRTQHVYFSPELNAEVKYVDKNTSDGVKRILEYVRTDELI